MLIGNRTGKTKRTQNGCPYCSGRYATADNNLAVTHPEIAREFHSSLNGDLRPEKLLPKSNIRVWWTCDDIGHEPWEQSPNARVGQNTGCPSCSGRVVSYSNSLSENYPGLRSFWDNDKNTGEFEDYSKGSHYRADWVCKICKSEWSLSVKDMVKRYKRSEETEDAVCLNCRKNPPK